MDLNFLSNLRRERSKVNLQSIKFNYFRIVFFLFMVFTFRSSLFAYDVIPVDHGGNLHGFISWKGNPPENVLHEVDKDANICGPQVAEETYAFNSENRGLQNVVISIEGLMQGKAPISSTLVIDNKNCHFVPHVQAGMVGQFYEVRNLDPIMHNTHLKMEKFTLLNIIMPAHGKDIKKNVPEPGIIKIQCDVHKFMRGWIFASENPYIAVTDHDGNYKISDIPPGKYFIKLWHEGLSVKRKEVTIFPGKNNELSMELTLQ